LLGAVGILLLVIRLGGKAWGASNINIHVGDRLIRRDKARSSSAEAARVRKSGSCDFLWNKQFPLDQQPKKSIVLPAVIFFVGFFLGFPTRLPPTFVAAAFGIFG
jgi:hypothetical protein